MQVPTPLSHPKVFDHLVLPENLINSLLSESENGNTESMTSSRCKIWTEYHSSGGTPNVLDDNLHCYGVLFRYLLIRLKSKEIVWSVLLYGRLYTTS
jgi:hypothetical protein